MRNIKREFRPTGLKMTRAEIAELVYKVYYLQAEASIQNVLAGTPSNIDKNVAKVKYYIDGYLPNQFCQQFTDLRFDPAMYEFTPYQIMVQFIKSGKEHILDRINKYVGAEFVLDIIHSKSKAYVKK